MGWCGGGVVVMGGGGGGGVVVVVVGSGEFDDKCVVKKVGR